MTRFGRLLRQRTREEEALRVRAAEPLELARLHFALDTFGHHARVQRPRQRQDALDDRRDGRAAAGCFTNERSILSASTGSLCRWLSDE